MEKETLVIETKLLHPVVVGGTLTGITDLVLQSMIVSLFKGLSQNQKDILMRQHHYQPDPNGYTEPKNISLIRLLLLRSGVSPARLFLSSHFKIELFMHSLKEFTGIENYQVLKKEIDGINGVWSKHNPLGRIASIKVEERDSAAHGAKKGDKQHFLLFELF